MAAKKMHKVERHDGAILLPKGLSMDAAIAELQRRARYEAEPVTVEEEIPCHPFDGAVALEKAMHEKFGAALQTETPGFWGPSPPQRIRVEIRPGEYVSAPWGSFTIPGVKGRIATGSSRDADGRVTFQLYAEITHAGEEDVARLFSRTRVLATTESIYRGRSFAVRFRDGSGDYQAIPEIRFLEPSNVPPIFTAELERAIDANILTPIRYTEAARGAGIPLKRGTLLAGAYGTGKTLLASKIARVATEHGWTFLYIPACTDLSDALKFAQRYMPAIVFCEDVERIAGASRTDAVNDVLNTLDGITSKNDEIMLVLTSNHAETINPAMRRPGRIDMVLHVTAPDADACARLLAYYGEGIMMPDADMTGAGRILAGCNPATVREAMERAKLEAIRRTKGQDPRIIGPDVEAAADTLLAERELFAPVTNDNAADRITASNALAGIATALKASAVSAANGKRA